ncbi:MAG: hypothetical protein Q9220_001261 [cf. Caloplaca sp. 1 TL-2023]
MSNSLLISIPPGYCFLPSCTSHPVSTSITISTLTPSPTPSSLSTTTKPETSTSTHISSTTILLPSPPSSSTSPSPSQSRTTSTTTIFGPTFTRHAPPHSLSKRASASPSILSSLIPEIGTHPFVSFPTNAPVQVGAGPVCIVHCDWARMYMPGFSSNTSSPLTTSTSIVTTSTLTSTISTLSSTPLPQQSHSHPQTIRVVGFTTIGVASAALVAVAVWLITRKVRQVRARLNQHTMGVHRDLEREEWEMQGGVGVPECAPAVVTGMGRGEV